MILRHVWIFALQFHEYTFRDDANKFIPKYMDAATGDTSTLNYVDLSCTLNQITWADLKPEQMENSRHLSRKSMIPMM